MLLIPALHLTPVCSLTRSIDYTLYIYKSVHLSDFQVALLSLSVPELIIFFQSTLSKVLLVIIPTNCNQCLINGEIVRVCTRAGGFFDTPS